MYRAKLAYFGGGYWNICLILQSMDNELQLYKKMQQGDEGVLAQFFHEYMETLYWRALGFVKDSAVAEDIVQEVFIRFWELREQTEITDSVSGYLARAVDNRCRNHLEYVQVRKRYEQLHADDGEPVDSLPEEDEREELRERVRRFIDSLPEKCREIFVLACVEGLKYKEVAERLDVSVNTVKTQVKHAYAKLREEFNDKELPLVFWLLSMYMPYIE
jgi:RNA polymerase sigma-70 factor (ECF subfamily)